MSSSRGHATEAIGPNAWPCSPRSSMWASHRLLSICRNMPKSSMCAPSGEQSGGAVATKHRCSNFTYLQNRSESTGNLRIKPARSLKFHLSRFRFACLF